MTHAGETEQDIQPRLAFLRRNGISPILNYAVEDDVGHCSSFSEAACDANAARFLKSVDTCDTSDARGFVALKARIWHVCCAAAAACDCL